MSMNRIEKLIYRILLTKFNNNKRQPIPIHVVSAETGLGEEEINKVLRMLAIDNSITLHSDKTISVSDEALLVV